MAANWIIFDDSIEEEQPGETAMIEEIVASMERVNRKVFDQHRHALRDAHAKSHGVLKGSLLVDADLPGDLAQGIFQPGLEYGLVARLSSAPGNIHPDNIRSLKGMALKVIGVDGAKMLSGRGEDRTQDFLLVNLPVIPFGDVEAYLAFQRKMEEREGASPGTLLPELASGASSLLKAAGLPPNRTLEAVGATEHHILGETFHSMGAIRFGRHIAKISAAPLSPSVTSLAGQEVDPGENDSLYRDLVVAFFQTQSAEYEIRAQMCTDIARMPVEDASMEWPTDLSPPLRLGKLIFPPQDAYSPARRVFGDEILSFNPWHCIEAHRPLGSIMRSRRRAYEASSTFRHTMNRQPSLEPRAIDEIPD